ncbi:unnamed protein product [Sphagnum compactum]
MPPLIYTEIYRSCQSLRPSILRSYAGRCPLPLCGHYLYFAVYYDRPISVSFLNYWRGYEKLGNEAGAVEEREESYVLRYHLIRLSEGFRQPCISQAESAASQSPERPAARNGDSATTRQIVRILGHGKLVT